MNTDLAVLSKTLATIEVHADVEYDFEEAKLGNLYTEEAMHISRNYSLRTCYPVLMYRQKRHLLKRLSVRSRQRRKQKHI